MAEEEKGPEESAEGATAAPAVDDDAKPRHRRIRHKPSKRYKASKKVVETLDPRPIEEAVRILKGFKACKFDETVELHVRLGIDSAKSEQQVRGTFVFPHGIGGEKRVIAFAEAELAVKCEAAGAIAVGGAELAKKIEDGWLEFDVVVAHPNMMRHIGRLGRVLGPRGLMPNPKAGTVTPNVDVAVREFKAGKIEFKGDEQANLHVVVGRKSFEVGKLRDNIEAFLRHLEAMRPAGAKGIFMLRATVCSTMSPGVRIQLPS